MTAGHSAESATPDAYFEDQWSRSNDPWEHGTRWYEARKYAITAAAAPRERYRRAFEPGCGAGFLTTQLATRTDQLLAMEREPQGVAVARERCRSLPGVEVISGRIPHDWPAGRFDLIVFSEVLYYLDDVELDQVIASARDCLEPTGHVVAVHYRPVVPEHARRGDDVHAQLRQAFPTSHAVHVEDDFVLDVLSH